MALRTIHTCELQIIHQIQPFTRNINKKETGASCPSFAMLYSLILSLQVNQFLKQRIGNSYDTGVSLETTLCGDKVRKLTGEVNI